MSKKSIYHAIINNMLIPIDNDTNVRLQKPKSTAITLNDAINMFTDPRRIDQTHDNIINIAMDIYPDIASQKDYIKTVLYSLSRCKYALTSNNYIYLTADVCDMIAETQKSLKNWNIYDLRIEPDTDGVIIFEKPKYQTFVENEISKLQKLDHTNVVGILWCYEDQATVENESQKTSMLWISLMLDTNDKTSNKTEYGFGSNEFAYKVEKDGSLTPFWEYDKDIADNEMILNYFAATMMLMQQREIIAEPTTYAPTVKHGKRRDPVLVSTGDNGEKIPFRISTISLSETVRTAYAANSAGTSKKPTKSWWVKGHWRRQPYGPERSLRKLIYIHPHISGNVNAPLDDRKTMTKVVP